MRPRPRVPRPQVARPAGRALIGARVLLDRVASSPGAGGLGYLWEPGAVPARSPHGEGKTDPTTPPRVPQPQRCPHPGKGTCGDT